MNNPFQIFNSPIFGAVRAAYIDGVAWFVGNDVARALGYIRADMAVQRHVAMEDKKKMLVHILHETNQCMKEEAPISSPTLHRQSNDREGVRRKMIIINESGLYSLVLASRLPEAQEFKHWVTSEVLPSIRETGSYSLFTPAQVETVQQSPEVKPLDIPFNKQFPIHARNAEARDFKAFKKAQPEISPPLPDFERLLALADKFHDPNLRDKVLIFVANKLCGQDIF